MKHLPRDTLNLIADINAAHANNSVSQNVTFVRTGSYLTRCQVRYLNNFLQSSATSATVDGEILDLSDPEKMVVSLKENGCRFVTLYH